ncbi:MAG: T9SS type A sorting domain-containing protein [Bacteroidales bacterium]|nr:T9SS type A sorting domain-containing protein [Bacteroidales bacterium]
MNFGLNIPKVCAALVFMTLFITGQMLYAQTIQITNGVNTTTIIDNDYSLLSISNAVSSLNAAKIKTADHDFTQIEIEGYGFSTNLGQPKLPVLKKLIEIPLEANIEVVITYKRFKEISLNEFELYDFIYPAQPSLSKSTDPTEAIFYFDEDFYNIDDFLGNELVSVYPLGVMRGVNIARIEIAPIQYNPVANMIRVHDQITVEFRFTDGNTFRTIEMKQDQMNPFFSGITTMLFNYKEVENPENIFEAPPITYFIVSDPMFRDALQPFIVWKTRKGFRVIEAYTDNPSVGSTTGSIKDYLQNFYENPPEGFQPQSFVLIVGDVAQIPAFNGTTGNHVTDLYYCEYTGDMFPEAYYGRFSANNLDQLQSQIEKTLEYEQYAFPDPSFLDEVIMVAGQDSYHQLTWGNGQVNYGNDYYFNESNGLYSHTYLQPEPPGGNYSQLIRQNVSNGVAFANYTAHCSAAGWANPAFTVNNIQALENQSKYPLMIGNCCSSVEFQINSFGEDIMRAAGKGAIGYIGGSNSTYWDEDFWWGVGFKDIVANPTYDPQTLGAFDRMFHNQPEITLNDWHITQGQLPAAGNLAVTQSGSTLTNYYWEIYHLMGDPSLMSYFSQPPEAIATFPALIPLGAASFAMNTNPYAYVAVSKDGILYGAGFANEDGAVEIIFSELITIPGEAEIIITGQQLKPFFGTVLFASPNGPYVLLKEATVEDQTNGNNDGKMDYAETFGLNLNVQNYGQDSGSDIMLNLSTTDEFVTISDGVTTIDLIQPNEILSLSDVFEITTAETIPDGHIVLFLLEATNGEETWSSTFNLEGHSPVLEFAGFTINDQQGNNNGKFDPGEVVQITVYAKNIGSSRAFSTLGNLSTNDSFITVLSAEPQFFGDADPNELVSATFEVVANENTPAGHPAAFDLMLNANMGISGSGHFELTVGPIPVLIVDLDGNQNSANHIKEAVSQLGIVNEYKNTLPNDLSLYSSVFISVGVYNNNHILSAAEGQILADYLNSGGRLYLEGGDTWYYDPKTSVHPMFGINGISDGASDLDSLVGINGTLSAGLKMKYSGDNSWIDQLEAVNGAQTVFKNNNPEYFCAISKIGNGYKTIGTSFEFGGLAAEADRHLLMTSYLEFFEITIPGSLVCSAYALNDNICSGDTTQLVLEISGGSGNFRYTWSPETGLSNPSIQSPEAFPGVSTVYSIQIDDLLTGNVISQQVSLTVREKPQTPEIIQAGQTLVSSIQFGNQWYNDDGVIEGATGQVYAPLKTSNYYTIVTNAEGCISEVSNLIYYQSTFIDELISQGSFRIYPNPSDGLVNIDFIADGAETLTVFVFNAFGQSMNEFITQNIKRAGYNTITFNLSALPGGVYYFKIIEGDRLLTKKLILSK